MIHRITPLQCDNIRSLHTRARECVFWELGADVADSVFEKEAWLTRVLMEYGTCGLTLDLEEHSPAIASVLFTHPSFAMGIERLPSGPVSPDADLLTSLFVTPGFEGIGFETILIDAVLSLLSDRGTKAVEAFGLAEGYDEVAVLIDGLTALVEGKEAIGLLSVPMLESAGFKVIEEHPVLPRLRIELPPEEGLLSAAAVEELLRATALQLATVR